MPPQTVHSKGRKLRNTAPKRAQKGPAQDNLIQGDVSDQDSSDESVNENEELDGVEDSDIDNSEEDEDDVGHMFDSDERQTLEKETTPLDDDEDDGDIDNAIQKSEKKKKLTKADRDRQLNKLGTINTAKEFEDAIRRVFQEVQTTVAVHKRQLIILRTIMQRAVTTGFQSHFNTFFCHMLRKIIPIKYTIKAADKVVKFVSSFVQSVNPSNSVSNDDNDTTVQNTEITEETFLQFTNTILLFLRRGLDAKDKNVRYRSCQLLAYIIGECDNMEDELYKRLTSDLITRIFDKDKAVRVKAVQALACFQHSDGGALSAAGKNIRFVMQNDPSPEVRRVCLKNIEKNDYTEPFIVERARDEDRITRRLLFAKVLPAYNHITDIKTENRNRLLELGLKDRDESVRKAATSWLVSSWMHDLNNNIADFLFHLDVIESDIAPLAVEKFLEKRPELLTPVYFKKEFFDELTPQLALWFYTGFKYCLDNNKPDIIDSIFPEAAEFANLLEKYFRLRSENILKISENSDAIAEDRDLAERLGIIDPDEYNYIILQLLKIAVDYDYSDEFGRNKMFQVLRATLSSNSVTEPILPVLMECLRKLAINERDFCQMTIEIINDLKDSEYERVLEAKREEKKRKIVEEAKEAKELKRNKRKRRYGGGVSLIEEIDSSDTDEDDDESLSQFNKRVEKLIIREENGEDGSDSDDEYHSAVNDMSRQSAIEANKSRQEEINQVAELPALVIHDCLTIAKCMLQLVFLPLKENMALISLLENLITPCINTRSEIEIRSLALICQGLCGILDKEVATSTMVIAAIFATRSENESLIITGLHVIGDLLSIHRVSILQDNSDRSIDSMAVAKIFYRALKDDKMPEVQLTTAITLFKLLLAGVIKDYDLLELTLLTYFNPNVNKNLPLKQCLSFCIPAYVFSHKEHQEMMAAIVSDTIERSMKVWNRIVHANVELELKTPITPTFIIDSLIDWTDATNLAIITKDEMESISTHVDVGIQFMKLLRNYDYTNDIHKKFYKPILKGLSKLTFTPKADINKLRKFSQCFDDENLFNGDIDTVLDSDAICKRSFLKCHKYVQECVKIAEKLEEEKQDARNDLAAANNPEGNYVEVENGEKEEKEEEKNFELNDERKEYVKVKTEKADSENDDSETVIVKTEYNTVNLDDEEEDAEDSDIDIVEETVIVKTEYNTVNLDDEEEDAEDSDIDIVEEVTLSKDQQQELKEKMRKAANRHAENRVIKPGIGRKHKKSRSKTREEASPAPAFTVGETSEIILLDSDSE
ncbi:hypothetical protein CANINC_000700 [Pichia inconspicua]|uniref:Nuclear condensin complex subunit 3 C-terminal domain-containing protein n=1 Tax=Pichia inconspicua TaxID=52247 RepID=A0A4T0X7E3_9ASCO|nr:hypothetical protein CANINC_000700 [[Candida] inconspicua]